MGSTAGSAATIPSATAVPAAVVVPLQYAVAMNVIGLTTVGEIDGGGFGYGWQGNLARAPLRHEKE